MLDFGALLLSSGGHEYDVGDDISKSPTERLLRQKQSLRRRLGNLHSHSSMILIYSFLIKSGIGDFGDNLVASAEAELDS